MVNFDFYIFWVDFILFYIKLCRFFWMEIFGKRQKYPKKNRKYLNKFIGV